MNAAAMKRAPIGLQQVRGPRVALQALVLAGILAPLPAPAFAAQGPEANPQQTHATTHSSGSPATQAAAAAPVNSDAQDMDSMDMGAAQVPPGSAAAPQTPTAPPMNMGNAGPGSNQAAGMAMSAMTGGKAPADARDPNAYSEGYDYGSMPGLEQVDRISTNRLLVDQLEFTHGDQGSGTAWDIHDWYGPDEQKLLLRTEGGLVKGKADFTTGAEALWWRPATAFWSTVLGLHQDFGAGSHTSVAFGIEGLTPYSIDLEATGYLDETGRFSARLKGTYDVLLTNRLILTPEAESNLFSRADPTRGVGAGVSNIELSMRLRYEFSRRFAPYIGFTWDRALGGSADLRTRAGEPVGDVVFVAGVRMLL